MDAESLPVSIGDVVAHKYRLDRVLGSGGMGTVFLATHLDLDSPVAIKILRPAAAANQSAVDRFAREGRACARLRSENIVRVTDVGALESGLPYMVMEYLEGADLEQLLRVEGPLTVSDAVDYVLQACAGLAEAHAAGVVHRDLKPANLFLAVRSDGHGVVKVVDFGIAKVARVGDNLTKTGDLMGSPLYMSPEQLTSARDTDARADVWALGVILYELLAGAPPFDGETIPQVCAAVLVGEPTPIDSRRADLPPALGVVLAKCLQKKVEDRYASVLELADALAALAPDQSAATLARIAHLSSGTTGAATAERLSRLAAVPASLRRSTQSASAETAAPWSPAETSVIPAPLSKRAWPLGAAVAVAAIVIVGMVVRRAPAPVAPSTPVVEAVTVAPASAPPAALVGAAARTAAPGAEAAIALDAGAPSKAERVNLRPTAPRAPAPRHPRRTKAAGAKRDPALEAEIRAVFPTATGAAPGGDGEGAEGATP